MGWPQVQLTLADYPHVGLTYFQRGSWYPSDLIQLWEDHEFISILARSVKLKRSNSTPTYKFDSLYSELLSHHPDLLFVLRSKVVSPTNGWCVFHLFGSHQYYRSFHPFLAVRQSLQIPFPPGDSPLDFLIEPRRAQQLYSDPQDITQAVVLRWIQYIKEVLGEGVLLNL
jgi:hypothetical protein